MTSTLAPNPVFAYLKRHRDLLELIERMWSDSRVLCYNDRTMPSPEEFSHGSVFLAGPTSRHQILEYNWRSQMVAELREAGFTGLIFIPEPRGVGEKGDFTDKNAIHKWETDRLFAVTNPVFWIPRDSNELLGLNTNFELGTVCGLLIAKAKMPEDVFIGWPEGAERMGLPHHYATALAGCRHYYSIDSLAFAVTAGYPRHG